MYIPELYLYDLTPGGGHSVHAAPVLRVVSGMVRGPDDAAGAAELTATRWQQKQIVEELFSLR